MSLIDREKFISNTKNSIFHALEHFSELSLRDKATILHHEKWVVLSVHHASECFLKILLDDFGHCFKKDNPGLSYCLKILKDEYFNELRVSEKKLLELLNEVNVVRNEFIHRNMPEDVNITVIAWAMLALLRAIALREGIPSKEIFDQSPPVEATLLELIKYDKLTSYIEYVEKAIYEEHPDIIFCEQCSYCDARAILYGTCQVCFERFEETFED